jgi:hypothetical protein
MSNDRQEEWREKRVGVWLVFNPELRSVGLPSISTPVLSGSRKRRDGRRPTIGKAALPED